MRATTLLFGVPSAILIVALAVANRAPVTLNLDPFNPAAPALAIDAPLWLLLLGALLIGLLAGWLATWWDQTRFRRAARRQRLRAERAERALEKRAGLPALR